MTATCTTCAGEGAIWLGALELDACPGCAALAEAAFQASTRAGEPPPPAPALRVIQGGRRAA